MCSTRLHQQIRDFGQIQDLSRRAFLRSGLDTDKCATMSSNYFLSREVAAVDWLAFYGAVTGSIGTAMSVYLIWRLNSVEHPNLSPYMTDWIVTNESSSHVVLGARLVVQNRSRVSNTVERVLLQAREDEEFAFQPAKLKLLNDGKAYVDFQGGAIEEICRANDALSLPLNISGNASVSRWLGLSIKPRDVERAKKYHWRVRISDQSGKHFASTVDRDQVIQ